MIEADRIRLQHMLDAARAARRFVEDKDRAAFDADLQVQFAVIRALEIVGEAANRVTKAVQEHYPQIPWSAVIGMRNVLIHAYFDVDLEQVWKTVQNSLPVLSAELEKILSAAE